MIKNFQSPRGTHDILPEQIAEWRLIETTFRELCARYNYGEIRTPLFESTELFARAAGEASDIVVTKQMYSFTAPDEQSYTLRPEGTAGTVRAFIEAHLNERGPVTKLGYLGPMFRYEAPQAGRQRQFHQCGVELLGAAGPESDAEVLALGADFLKDLGIEAKLHLNTLGTPQSRAVYLEELKAFLGARRESLSEDSQKRLEKNPLRVFDSKDERDRAAIAEAPRLLDYLRANDEESTAHFTKVCQYLDNLGVAYEVDPLLVRGLDYYTHTAFEFISDKLGAQSTVLAGGRYDKLVEELGGPAIPGIGWGAGIERLLLVRATSQLETAAAPQLTAFLVTMGDNARAAGVGILRRLREAGISADCDFVGRSVKAQMREANRQNARFALLLGDNELEKGTVTVKDLAASEQNEMPVGEAIQKLIAVNADATVAKYFNQQD
jgi:histidyl-tRNA synthetase